MKKRVFITGGSGLLAVNCAQKLRHTHEVTLALHKHDLKMVGVEAKFFDLESPKSIAITLAEIQPDYIIHTAAITNVEQCQADPEMAHRVNVKLSAELATGSAQARCGFVHLSTDHLFDGKSPLSREETPVCPLNVYGKTKAEAEMAVIAAHPSSLIIRTNFYGWGPPWRKSFSDSILAALRAGKTSNLFTDVYYTPILAASLIEAIVDLAEGGWSGCFNVVGDERLSKYEFGLRLAQTFGLDERLLCPTSIADLTGLVARPRDMSLSNAKTVKALHRQLGDTNDHLRRLLEEERTGAKRELDELDYSSD